MTSQTSGGPVDRPTGLGLAIAIGAALIWGLASVSSIVAASRGGVGLLGTSVGAMVAALTWMSIGTLVIWAVLFFAFVRPRAPHRGAAHLAFIAATILLTQLVAVGSTLGIAKITDNRAQSRIAMQSMKSDLATIARADPEHPPTIDLHPKATGPAGAVEGAVKTYFSNVLNDRAHYIADLKSEGFITVMSPRNLASDPGLKRSRRIMDGARALVAKYQALNTQRVEEIKRAIHSSGLSDEEKAGFDEGLAGNSRAAEIWALEFKIVDECQQAVDGLAHARGRWLAEGEMLRFADAGDMEDYNRHIQAIKAIAAQEDSLRSSAMGRANSAVENGLDASK